MGYSTDFNGHFNIKPTMQQEHIAYLNEFNNTRRMQRDVDKTKKLSDPLREAVGLPVGTEGEFFVGVDDESIINHNSPPSTQPGLWCQWLVAKGGTIIEAEGDKFYSYTEWLKYIIENFLKPWGYTVNGEVTWAGEDPSDLGKITVKNNVVLERAGTIVYT